jgi:hypothetical protein
MKFSLLLSERIHLLLVEETCIKETGSFLELIVIRDITDFVITETKTEEKTGLKWEQDGAREFELTETEFHLLWNHINTLNMNRALNEKLFRLASAINDIISLSGV